MFNYNREKKNLLISLLAIDILLLFLLFAYLPSKKKEEEKEENKKCRMNKICCPSLIQLA